jgi:chromosome segregation ATPase
MAKMIATCDCPEPVYTPGENSAQYFLSASCPIHGWPGTPSRVQRYAEAMGTPLPQPTGKNIRRIEAVIALADAELDEQAKTRASGHERQIIDLGKENERLREGLAEVNSDVHRLEAENARLRQRGNLMNLTDRLRRRTKALEQRADEVAAQAERVVAENERLTERIDVLCSEIEAHNSGLAKDAEVKRLKSEIERLTIEPDDIEAMLGIDPNDPVHKVAKVAVEWKARALKAEAKREPLAERLLAEFETLLDVEETEGGYDCCGCSAPSVLLHNVIARLAALEQEADQ